MGPLIVDIAVFSRMRGDKFSERLAVQDSNTPHLCDYRYKLNFKHIQARGLSPLLHIVQENH